MVNYNTDGEYSCHPYYPYFHNMISRAERFGLPNVYKRGLEFFNQWLKDIGEIPESMKTPTVGRIDHDKGYVIENGVPNFRWQEKSENTKEQALRIKPLDLTPETRSVAGRNAIKAQIEKGNHASQTGKTAFHTGAAAKASLKSPNFINNRYFTCPACGKSGRGPSWKHHQNNLVCQK